ncbi:hypothetical protein FRB90_012188 [Tulasnella sp. 427]|nr:hypothetical protein FRB90_012188 [Tulasnella sp. 427]
MLKAAIDHRPSTSTEDPCKKLPGLIRHEKPNTFRLVDVATDDFNLFVSALRCGGNKFNFSVVQIRKILPLVTKWEFLALQERCITAYNKLLPPPLEKLELARQTKISEWIREVYLYFAVRNTGVKIAEAQALGSAATSVISHAREEILLRRLQLLTLASSTAETRKCISLNNACRQSICEVQLMLLTRKNPCRPKKDNALARLFRNELSGCGKEICDACKVDATLVSIVRSLKGEIDVAQRVFEDDLGRDVNEWLKHA